MMNLGKETETLEFKKSTGELREAMVSISSILNKHGVGTLYFGVKNNGDAVGQTVSESSLRDVSRCIYESIRPQIQSDIPNVTLDVTLNGTEMSVLALLKQKPDSSREELVANIIKTTRTVQRALDSLKEKGYIRRIGSRQKPRWEILK